jgi:glycosyltransferase involved in cell wall biosynthesis
VKDLVSIVTILFNSEKFLTEAIQTVRNQSYSEWELLLVDDGSTDFSTEIAKKAAAEDPSRIHYLEHDKHQNRGMSASRNLGIRQSGGKFVAFLDSDDVWVSDKLEKQVPLLNSFPEAAMLCGSTLYWSSWTGKRGDQKKDRIVELGDRADQIFSPPELLIDLHPLGNDPAPSLSGVLLRKNVFERVGEFEEKFTGMFEDQAFLAKVYLHEFVYVSSSVWDYYRIHKDSCMAKTVRNGQQKTMYIHYLDWLNSYLQEQKVQDLRIWRALDKARWRVRHPILAAASPQRFGRLLKRNLALLNASTHHN